MRQFTAVIVFAMLGAVEPTQAQFGGLAPNPALRFGLAGVRVELGVSFAMDPSFIAARIPRGFRPLSLGETALKGDSSARRAMAAHPELADHVLATFAIARLDSMTIEGESVRPNIMALWWVPVQQIDTSDALPDARGRPGAQLVELGSWSADASLGRKLGAIMPAATTATISAERDHTGLWRVLLEFPGSTIVGSCRPQGKPIAANYPLPQFSTVWAAGESASVLVVYTYYGHMLQPCRGNWQAVGKGALARAFTTGTILSTDAETSWRAQAAAYAAR